MEKKEFKNPPTILRLKRTNEKYLLISMDLATDNQTMYDELHSTIDSIVAKYIPKLKDKKK